MKGQEPSAELVGLLWEDVPAAEKVRLKRREAAQRRHTETLGLPALPISVQGLWLVQRGMCTCNKCRGNVPLEVGRIVVAHPFYRAGKGSPGHVPTNVSLWLERCNRREARKEVAALAKGRRLAALPSGDRTKPKPYRWAKQKNFLRGRYKRKINGQVVPREDRDLVKGKARSKIP